MDLDLDLANARHADLLATRRHERQTRYDLACLLVAFANAKLYRALGFATVADYGRVSLDLEPRETRELLRMGRRLPELPLVEAALASGELDWTKACEIAKVAGPKTEALWLDRARSVTSRALEQEVRSSMYDEPPPDGPCEALRSPARQRLVFEMDTVEADLVRQMLALVRYQSNLTIDEADDGTVLADLARRVLHEATEPPDGAHEEDAPSAEPWRVTLEHCPDCARTTSREAEVTDEITAQARCDAEILDMTPGPDRGTARRTIPARVRRQVLHRDGYRCAVPHCRHSWWLHLHHLDRFAEGGAHVVENLATVCGLHHRLIHAGLLSLELSDGKITAEHADGRRYIGRGWAA
ncbi:MAG: HNH endonuclease [Deltaproteobacteria bacterium]|nr:HNH endonuclease [Deltaproteobacteria bacterium]